MKTRLIKLVVIGSVLIISFYPSLQSNASNKNGPGNPPTLPEWAQGTRASSILEEVGGNRKFELNPALVEAVQIDQNSYYLTYEVGIPQDMLNEESSNKGFQWIISSALPTAVKAGSDSHYGCDSTVSVCATLTLYYVDSGAYGYYQKVTNSWTRKDSTVSLSSAKVKAGCYAEWYTGTTGDRCSTIVSKTIGTPILGTTYSFTPWFAGSSHKVLLNGFNGIAGYQSVTLKRGVTTWNFAFCVNYEGSEVILGCY